MGRVTYLLTAALACWAVAGARDEANGPVVLPPDAQVVAERHALTDGLMLLARRTREAEADFEHRRDVLFLLGYLRPDDPASVREVLASLTLYKEPGYYINGIHVYNGLWTMDYMAPGIYAAARIGLPALPGLLEMLSEDADAAPAVAAVKVMLGRGAAYWLPEQVQTKHAFGWSDERLFSSRDLLWPAYSMTALGASLPKAPDDPLIALASPDPNVRYLPAAQVRFQRDRQVAALTARVADRAADAADRRSAATTLGRIRGVSEAGVEALIDMLVEERLTPDQALSEAETPAALALVRIDAPTLPLLMHTITTSGSRRMRQNCVAVVVVMLGERATPWLEDAVEGAPPGVRDEVAEALALWTNGL